MAHAASSGADDASPEARGGACLPEDIVKVPFSPLFWGLFPIDTHYIPCYPRLSRLEPEIYKMGVSKTRLGTTYGGKRA